MTLKYILSEAWHFAQWFHRNREWSYFTLAVTILVSVILLREAGKPIEYVQEAHAQEVEEVEKPVMIEVEIEWTKERIEKEIREVFPESPNTMVRVAQCESGMIATATGPTNDHGIFQLHMPSHGAKIKAEGIDVNDPAENIQFARYLYDNGGLAHWKASKHCWSK